MQSLTHSTVGHPVLWERLSLASGIVYSLLQLGGLGYFFVLVFPQMGPPDAPAQHAAFYAQQGEVLRLGNYLIALPAPFFLMFLGGLFGVLWRAASGSETLAVASVAAGAFVAMLWPMSAALSNIAIDIAQAGGDSGHHHGVRRHRGLHARTERSSARGPAGRNSNRSPA